MIVEMHKQKFVYPNFNPDEKTKRLVLQYIPDSIILEDDSSQSTSNYYPITIKQGLPQFVVSEQGVSYSSPEIIDGDVMAITSRVAEYLWSQQGIYSIHSSAINIDGKTILIPGRSGSGKTTTMMEFVKRVPGTSILSGDRTLIDEQKIVAGTKLLNFVASSLAEEFPELSGKLEKYTVDNRVKFTPEESPLTYSFGQFPIDAIIYPNKHPGQFIGTELKGVSRLTRLVNQGYHFLDEFPRLLLGNMTPLSTPVTDEQRQKTLYEMQALSTNVPSYSTSGTLADIVKFVEREIL